MFNIVAEKIDYDVLTRFLLKSTSKYEKIVSSNMNPADHAVQRKVSEATDLQGIFSRFGASKQILNSIRVDNEGDKSTVTTGTSRVNSFKLHQDFTDAVVWMVDTMKLIRRSIKSLPQSHFIDGFATPVNFSQKINDLTPMYVLIRFGVFKDEIESGQIQKCVHLESEKNVDLEQEVFNNERLFELEETSKGTYENGPVKVFVHKKSISVSVDSFKDIILHMGEDVQVSLNNYINSGNHFLVVFDSFEYVYSHRMIFKDSKLLGDPTNFLNTFWPFQELTAISSEKGTGYKGTSTDFQNGSIFKFVETHLTGSATYLVCDDLGTEWGDFISANDDEIIFYHAKYHSEGLSASNLENVFGQAQKNFGFLELTDEMIDSRKSRWESNYKLNGILTSVSRLRKAPTGKKTVEDFKTFVNQVSSNANIKRKVFVVINFISKSELEKALGLLRQGKPFRNQGVTLQILWFVNALLASANNLAVEFRIICRP